MYIYMWSKFLYLYYGIYSASFGLIQRRIYWTRSLLYRNIHSLLYWSSVQIIAFMHVTVTRDAQGSVRFVNEMQTETYLRMHFMPSCDATVNTYFGSRSHLAGFSKDSQNQILSKPLYPEQCYYVIISIKVTNHLHTCQTGQCRGNGVNVYFEGTLSRSWP
jgi:hypothetical protein